MLARITRQKNGIVEYLKSGKRKDSEYTRQEKDNVIPLYGNLDTLDQSIKYLNKNKKYKDDYLHITLSFSKNDIKKLDDMDQLKREQTLRDITETYIKHHTKGYDLKNEVIAYAEVHKPKIKVNEENKERLEHIHIVISNQNALNNTRLRTTFANTFIDDTLQAYINKKYGFDNPKDHKREKISELAVYRNLYKQELANIKSHDELIKYFEKNEINYKEVKTKNNHYYKITIKNAENKEFSINLRGKDFKHLETLTTNKEYEFPHTKDTQDLEKILNSYYEKREKEISKRRSKADTEKLKALNYPYLSQYQHEEEPSISFTNKAKKPKWKKSKVKIYKGKFYIKHYYTTTQKDLQTLYNKQKNIKIEDKKNKLSVNFSTCNDKAQAVNDILEIALAKGWKLEELSVNGSDEFKKEVYKQIKQRLEKKQKEKELKQVKTIERAATPIQQAIKTTQDTNTTYDKEKLNEIKNNINTHKVLQYAQKHYKINIYNYEPTSDNKINNKTNKQKPKSVVDFLNKEVGLPLKESIEILNKIYEEQKQEQNINKNINNKDLRKDLPKNDIIQTRLKRDKGDNLKISITKNFNNHSSQEWQTIELKGYNDLKKVITTYSYSSSNFENGYRKGENVTSFNPFLIYDIDNEKNKPNLSMVQAENILHQNKINALIIPTKSHNIDKNGYIAERFRIIIPLQGPIKNTDLEVYRETQKIISDKLGLTQYTDTKAMRDKARYYAPSPQEHILKAKVINTYERLDITNYEKQAEITTEQKRQEHIKKMEDIKNKAIQETNKQINDYNNSLYTSNYINVVDFKAIVNNVDITQLITHFEKLETPPYSDSTNYLYYETKNSKYSIINLSNGGKLACDFKDNNETYNAVDYLKKSLHTSNLTNINNYLKSNGFGDYSSLNVRAIQNTISTNKDNLYSLEDIKKAICKRFDIGKVDIKQDDTIKLKIFDKNLDFGPNGTKQIQEIINANNDKKRELEEQQKPQPQQIQTITKPTKAKEKDIKW